MKFEKTLKMTVDAVIAERPDGKRDLKLIYSLEESDGNQPVVREAGTELIPYEQLLEIQKQNRRSA